MQLGKTSTPTADFDKGSKVLRMVKNTPFWPFRHFHEDIFNSLFYCHNCHKIKKTFIKAMQINLLCCDSSFKKGPNCHKLSQAVTSCHKLSQIYCHKLI